MAVHFPIMHSLFGLGPRAYLCAYQLIFYHNGIIILLQQPCTVLAVAYKKKSSMPYYWQRSPFSEMKTAAVCILLYHFCNVSQCMA